MIRYVTTSKIGGPRRRKVRIVGARRARVKSLPALKLVTHFAARSLPQLGRAIKCTEERSLRCVDTLYWRARADAIDSLERAILRLGKARCRAVIAWGMRAKAGKTAIKTTPKRWRFRSA